MPLRTLLTTVLTTVVAAAALVCTTQTAADASARAGCGDVPPYVYGLRADHLGCRAAKRVANAWVRKAVDESGGVDPTVTVRGFRCHYAADVSRVSCRDGAKRVRFRAALL
jgi:hypothetical protein